MCVCHARTNALPHTDSKKEVSDWLASKEGKDVFANMEGKLLEEIGRDRWHRTNKTMHHGVLHALSATNKTKAGGNQSDPIYVYLAADNEEVKEAFAQELEKKHDEHYEIKVMRVRTNGIMHVKNLAKMKAGTNDEGVMDMVFDWYSLSLSNVCMAWRKGGTHLISTFIQSASRVSGTPKRTNTKKALGQGGIGTLGSQLRMNKHGGYHWDPFWNYGFLEDYQKPGDRRRLREKMAPLAQPQPQKGV